MFKSILRSPDSATIVGLMSAVGVYLIYNNALPNATDLRMAQPHNPDVESERKAAAWKSAALIGVTFLVARDLNSYIISGAALVGIDYLYKHSNAIHPATGKVDTSTTDTTIAPDMGDSNYPLPDYASDDGS